MTCESNPRVLPNNARSRIDAIGRPGRSGAVRVEAAIPRRATVLAAIVPRCGIGLALFGLVALDEMAVQRSYGGEMSVGGCDMTPVAAVTSLAVHGRSS